jgi:hypothetical protein
METKIKQQNEEALLNAFKIEELEERLEMTQAAGGNWPSRSNNGCHTGGSADGCNQF